MGRAVHLVHQRGNVAVLLGGASLGPHDAARFGADGYSRNAAEALAWIAGLTTTPLTATLLTGAPLMTTPLTALRSGS